MRIAFRTFKAAGDIKTNPLNFLGHDSRNRKHWRKRPSLEPPLGSRELAFNWQRVRDAAPVAIENPLTKISDPGELREAARAAYWNLAPSKTPAPDSREVIFPHKAFHKVAGHSAKRAVLEIVPALESLVGHAHFLFAQADNDPRLAKSRSWRTYGVRATLRGQSIYVRLTTKCVRGREELSFYDTNSLDERKVKDALSDRRSSVTNRTSDRPERLSRDILFHVAQRSNGFFKAKAQPPCPHCGSADTGLLPPDFETCKCGACGRNFAGAPRPTHVPPTDPVADVPSSAPSGGIVTKSRLRRWIAKATQLSLFGGAGNIRQNPENHLGTDRIGRPHWRTAQKRPRIDLAGLQRKIADLQAAKDRGDSAAVSGAGFTRRTSQRSRSLDEQVRQLEQRRTRMGLRIAPPHPDLFAAPMAPARVEIERLPPHDFDVLAAWDRLSREGQDNLLRGWNATREQWAALSAPQRADLLGTAIGGGADSRGRAAEILRTAAGAVGRAAQAVSSGPQPDPKVAAKLRTVADNMASTIENYHNPGVSRQNVTVLRSRIAASMMAYGDYLEGVQSVLYALADMYENGTVPPLLATVRSPAMVEALIPGRYPRALVKWYDLRKMAEHIKGKRLDPTVRERFHGVLRRRPDDANNVQLHRLEEIAAVDTIARKLKGVGDKYDYPEYFLTTVLENLKGPKRALAAGFDTAEKWDKAAVELSALKKVTDRSEVRRLQALERSMVGLNPKTTVALCCGGRSPGCDLPFGPAAPAT